MLSNVLKYTWCDYLSKGLLFWILFQGQACNLINNQDTISQPLIFEKKIDTLYISASDHKLEYSFNFRNDNRTPIFINAIEPSCNCTEIRLSDSSIVRGKQAQLALSVNIEPFEREKIVYAVIKSNSINKYEMVKLYIFRK
jgi:hypothetical protein